MRLTVVHSPSSQPINQVSAGTADQGKSTSAPKNNALASLTTAQQTLKAANEPPPNASWHTRPVIDEDPLNNSYSHLMTSLPPAHAAREPQPTGPTLPAQKIAAAFSESLSLLNIVCLDDNAKYAIESAFCEFIKTGSLEFAAELLHAVINKTHMEAYTHLLEGTQSHSSSTFSAQLLAAAQLPPLQTVSFSSQTCMTKMYQPVSFELRDNILRFYDLVLAIGRNSSSGQTENLQDYLAEIFLLLKEQAQAAQDEFGKYPNELPFDYFKGAAHHLQTMPLCNDFRKHLNAFAPAETLVSPSHCPKKETLFKQHVAQFTQDDWFSFWHQCEKLFSAKDKSLNTTNNQQLWNKWCAHTKNAPKTETLLASWEKAIPFAKALASNVQELFYSAALNACLSVCYPAKTQAVYQAALNMHLQVLNERLSPTYKGKKPNFALEVQKLLKHHNLCCQKFRFSPMLEQEQAVIKLFNENIKKIETASFCQLFINQLQHNICDKTLFKLFAKTLKKNKADSQTDKAWLLKTASAIYHFNGMSLDWNEYEKIFSCADFAAALQKLDCTAATDQALAFAMKYANMHPSQAHSMIVMRDLIPACSPASFETFKTWLAAIEPVFKSLITSNEFLATCWWKTTERMMATASTETFLTHAKEHHAHFCHSSAVCLKLQASAMARFEKLVADSTIHPQMVQALLDFCDLYGDFSGAIKVINTLAHDSTDEVRKKIVQWLENAAHQTALGSAEESTLAQAWWQMTQLDTRDLTPADTLKLLKIRFRHFSKDKETTLQAIKFTKNLCLTILQKWDGKDLSLFKPIYEVFCTFQPYYDTHPGNFFAFETGLTDTQTFVENILHAIPRLRLLNIKMAPEKYLANGVPRDITRHVANFFYFLALDIGSSEDDHLLDSQHAHLFSQFYKTSFYLKINKKGREIIFQAIANVFSQPDLKLQSHEQIIQLDNLAKLHLLLDEPLPPVCLHKEFSHKKILSELIAELTASGNRKALKKAACLLNQHAVAYFDEHFKELLSNIKLLHTAIEAHPKKCFTLLGAQIGLFYLISGMRLEVIFKSDAAIGTKIREIKSGLNSQELPIFNEILTLVIQAVRHIVDIGIEHLSATWDKRGSALYNENFRMSLIFTLLYLAHQDETGAYEAEYLENTLKLQEQMRKALIEYQDSSVLGQYSSLLINLDHNAEDLKGCSKSKQAALIKIYMKHLQIAEWLYSNAHAAKLYGEEHSTPLIQALAAYTQKLNWLDPTTEGYTELRQMIEKIQKKTDTLT